MVPAETGRPPPVEQPRQVSGGLAGASHVSCMHACMRQRAGRQAGRQRAAPDGRPKSGKPWVVVVCVL